jgi:Ser/Thr protein kinase RdoA (MazF antagonist)
MTMFEHGKPAARDETVPMVLTRFAPRIVPLRTESLGNRGGFSGAALWRVVTSQGDFALRRWPRDGLPRDRVLGLHRLLEHLHREGVPFVSVPLVSNEGTTLVSDKTDDWQLEPWMPGIADFHANPSPARLRAAMAALAQWHLAAARFVPTGKALQWFATQGSTGSPAVIERLQRLRDAGEIVPVVATKLAAAGMSPIHDLARRILELFRRYRTVMMGELQLVRDVRVGLQPCLRDVWHDHLLFRDDAVTGLIDPAACRTESIACDLSRLIGSLVADDRSSWELAIEQYHRLRPLSTGERALVAVLDRSGVLLSGWTWLEWLYLERRTFQEAVTLQTRLNFIRKRMERMEEVST